MSSEVTEVATCRYKVSVTVPAKEVAEYFAKSYRDVSKQVQIKGFRRGHVPAAVLQRRYGKAIAEEVTYKIFEETFTKALKDKNLFALGSPDVDVNSLSAAADKDFVYSTEVDVRPQFDLPAYSELKLTGIGDEVTDEKVSEQIETMRAGVSPLAETDENAAAGMFVEVSGSVALKDGGEEVEKIDHRLVKLEPSEVGAVLALGICVPDADKAFIGAGKGAEKSFDIAIGDNYAKKDLVGKAAVVKLTVDAVKKVNPVPVERLASMFGVADEAALRQNIKERMEHDRDEREMAAFTEQVLEQLVAKAKFDLPAEYIKRQAEQMLEQKRNVKRMESKEGDEAAAEKELQEEARKDAEKSVREAIIIDTIAEKEKIEIAESDLSQYVMNLSRRHNVPPMEVYKLLRKPEIAMQITRSIVSAKALKFVVEQVKKNGAA